MPQRNPSSTPQATAFGDHAGTRADMAATESAAERTAREWAEAVTATVDRAPALSDAQRDRLATLLAPVRIAAPQGVRRGRRHAA